MTVADSAVTERPSSYRWTICALLFVATTINYVDRQVLGILAPTLQRELHWTEADYGNIVSWFSFAYAFGFLAAGRVIDWIGVRRGLGAAVVAWSLAAISHALATTAAGFSFARAALGVSESAIFPGSIKAVAEWFPQRERALATGIFNAGTNTGAILTPLLVPWIALRWGWQWAFVVTGVLGLLWLLVWIPLYRNPEATVQAGAASAAAGDKSVAVFRASWISLFGHRQTWAFIVGKLMADPVWWFYLYWLPKFLDSKYNVKLAQVAAPIIVVYLIADVGSVGGGWLSSALIKRGWTVNRARKTTMLAMALLIVPTTLVSRA
ncbi:MAG TPA: MFS transporter, partial [Gemmatimonadaceae bacterium]|nr:MFS transporter [Gemmatimonadaceae bacterium]